MRVLLLHNKLNLIIYFPKDLTAKKKLALSMSVLEVKN